MDINKPKNDLLSNNTSTENSEIQNKIYTWLVSKFLLVLNCNLIYIYISIHNFLYIFHLIIHRFLENGLINKLQTHIRQQMITVVKDNLTSNTNKINITSPKVQAINLLIAEFLLYQENFYTLSIFISEVGIIQSILF